MFVQDEISEEPELADEAQPVVPYDESKTTRRSSPERRAHGKRLKAPAGLMASIPDTNLSYNQALKGEARSQCIAVIGSEMGSLHKTEPGTWCSVQRPILASARSTKSLFLAAKGILERTTK